MRRWSLLACRSRGVTLVELMVAMVIGLLVAAGIISVFLSTSHSNRVQNQLALLQEEGRYAIGRLSHDLRMANSQYCTNTGGNAVKATNGILLDGLRAPTVYANDLMSALSDVGTPWGSSLYPAQPNSPYSLPSGLWMRGYACDANACSPAAPASIPAAGKTAGKRVVGTSILTVRYLDPSRGWALDGASTLTTTANGTVAAIHVVPTSGEPPLSDFKAGHLALLADCAASAVFAVAGTPSSGQFSPAAVESGVAGNNAMPVVQPLPSAPRLYDFNTDFLTVTYYAKVVDIGEGKTTGALVRRVNGEDQELVRGIERLDFLYGVELDGGTLLAPPSLLDDGIRYSRLNTQCLSVPLPVSAGGEPGCAWRAIKSVEVRLLMSGQQPLPSLTVSETAYGYLPDGDGAVLPPGQHAITPGQQGFDEKLLRRQFNALVALRNFNP